MKNKLPPAIPISTHAPAWGATCMSSRSVRTARKISTHAPAWGATPADDTARRCPSDFYSRPRVGGDSRRYPCPPRRRNFYSRPRVGGDQGISEYMRMPPGISTHAPAWGATKARAREMAAAADFYSRPRVGGDVIVTAEFSTTGIFLLTPPRGGRPTPIRFPPSPRWISTHAPAWGATSSEMGEC